MSTITNIRHPLEYKWKVWKNYFLFLYNQNILSMNTNVYFFIIIHYICVFVDSFEHGTKNLLFIPISYFAEIPARFNKISWGKLFLFVLYTQKSHKMTSLLSDWLTLNYYANKKL